MKKENLFYLLIVITILITRISIIIVPEFDIKLFDVVIHHFWFGIVLFLAGLIIPKNNRYLKIVLYGIGVGLVIDQLVFMILGAGKDKEYWALPPLLGAIIIALAVFPIRKKLVDFLLQKGVN